MPGSLALTQDKFTDEWNICSVHRLAGQRLYVSSQASWKNVDGRQMLMISRRHWRKFMMITSCENLFHITGPLCKESTVRWIHCTKGQWCITRMGSSLCAEETMKLDDDQLNKLWWFPHHALITNDTLKCIFLNQNVRIFIEIEFWLKFHWSLFLRVQLTIFQHGFRKWLGTDQVTSHYLNQCWYVVLKHICVTWPRWVKQTAMFNA